MFSGVRGRGVEVPELHGFGVQIELLGGSWYIITNKYKPLKCPNMVIGTDISTVMKGYQVL